MELVAGVVEVTGWAIDYERIEIIEVWIDGVMIDVVDAMGLPTPEVEEVFQWLPSSWTEDAGYRYNLDTEAEALSDGQHVLVIWSEDRFGNRTIIGERLFVIDNSSG